eukprot:scaffold1736_cov127-Cylindrotheca_fusiformis.AAC.39
MSITYEEALGTLEAMFHAPWTRELLDAVLRHENGHMENTCERILNHGDKDPELLVQRLKAGGPEPQVAMDEELARQLSAQEQGGRKPKAAAAAKKSVKKGRGTPTTLPDDFLRVPGYKIPPNAGASAAMDDETLARMLQDELFSEELARNPDFAHLARGSGGPRRSSARLPPGQRKAGAPAPNPFEGVDVMGKLSELGDGARRRLQIMAHNFETKLNARKNGANSASRAGLTENTSSAAERRGLLDDDDMEQIEFEMQKKDA